MFFQSWGGAGGPATIITHSANPLTVCSIALIEVRWNKATLFFLSVVLSVLHSHCQKHSKIINNILSIPISSFLVFVIMKDTTEQPYYWWIHSLTPCIIRIIIIISTWRLRVYTIPTNINMEFNLSRIYFITITANHVPSRQRLIDKIRHRNRGLLHAVPPRSVNDFGNQIDHSNIPT